MALGYTMVYGIVRLINFAQGDLSMIGAYIGWTLLTSLGVSHWPTSLALLTVVVVPMVFTALTGLLIQQAAYRPLLGKGAPVGIMITALGASLVLENGVLAVYGPQFKSYPTLLPAAGVHLGSAYLSYAQVVLFVLSVLLMFALYLFTQKTALGTAMRAVAVDHDAARLMGIDVQRVISVAFIIGAALAAASGVMVGLYYSQISFTMGFSLGLKAWTAAIIGGIGNIVGAMLGGFLIGLLESLVTAYVSSGWDDVIVFGILVFMLVFKPTGLLGERIALRM